jgi:hypothetical protein
MLRIALLCVHVVLLVLASTSFTIVTGPRTGHFEWQSFSYFSQSGWGLPYQFPYSLPVVLTYLAAYSVGLAGYAIFWRRGYRMLGAVGMLLCGIGFASFGYEVTHWLSDHYGSWIASAPAAAIVLALVVLIVDWRSSAPSIVA